jgi:hypothetical protein
MKINGDDDDDDDHVFVSINSTRVELNIESDNIWDSLKLLGFDDVTTTVGHINMEEENDDNDDDHSLLSDMEESDVILETPLILFPYFVSFGWIRCFPIICFYNR